MGTSIRFKVYYGSIRSIRLYVYTVKCGHSDILNCHLKNKIQKYKAIAMKILINYMIFRSIKNTLLSKNILFIIIYDKHRSLQLTNGKLTFGRANCKFSFNWFITPDAVL